MIYEHKINDMRRQAEQAQFPEDHELVRQEDRRGHGEGGGEEGEAPGGTEGGSDIVAEEDVGVEQHPQEGVGNVQGASLLDQSEVAEHPPLRQGEGGAAAGPERLDVAEGSILSEELLAHVLGILARVLDVLDVQGVERQDYTEEGRRRRSRHGGGRRMW